MMIALVARFTVPTKIEASAGRRSGEVRMVMCDPTVRPTDVRTTRSRMHGINARTRLQMMRVVTDVSFLVQRLLRSR
jgi:hypothetical protein